MFTRIALFFLNLISLLPFWFLYLLSDIIFFFIYYVIGYRRAVVKENLLNSFPEKTILERAKIEKLYYKYLGDLIVETIKMISISEDLARKHYKIVNPELLEGYFAQGKSVLAAAAHYGNWEMGESVSLWTDKTVLAIYKPLANKGFDNFFNKIRSRFGIVLAPMKLYVRKLAQHRHELTMSVFLGDQTPIQGETYHFVDFLNQPTAMFIGIEKIAKATNFPVIFCEVQVIKRGYYTCTFVPLVENPKDTADFEITKTQAKYLENIIKREPQYWLWSHKRWKFKPA